eukprot:CAMPEP_0198145676 /NCGR_PEP_ID=MMETSP1443-20131203/24841_1 /TAXON_ID=186043 /ORGANISM="Entomoneis sp., Strain CCMP2396" /LENGTH=161 /DNA_ID=CAMNT_0043809377 /DNA_START=125 /DNA_END=610 /DNA_ORIENTATION=+
MALMMASNTVTGFTVVSPSMPTASTIATQLSMFGGAGDAAPKEDDPEAMKQLEQAAASMGMTVEEYNLGMRARNRLTEQLDAARVTAGDDRVKIQRDGNNPPKFLEITITEDGKAMGQAALSKELCASLKVASEDSRKKRADSQKDMMAFVQEEMKNIGSA